MLHAALQQHVSAVIRENTGTDFSSLHFFPVGGGSINHTYQVETNTGQRFFCKINSNTQYPGLFESERQGLELLQAQNCSRIPRVIASTITGSQQVLILEWIEQGMRTPGFWQLFGQQLAALHSVEERYFGLDADNYMGALVQYNQKHERWEDFFTGQRLQPQVRMAMDAGLLSAKDAAQFEKVYKKLPELFPAANPCLLHGDLWSGNFLCDAQSRPVLIDPAVYYGIPAVDLAMTTLFGGFDTGFYESYQYYKPFPPNYREQWEVCNLYPLLIHLNLFGESYRSAIIHTIHRY